MPAARYASCPGLAPVGAGFETVTWAGISRQPAARRVLFAPAYLGGSTSSFRRSVRGQKHGLSSACNRWPRTSGRHCKFLMMVSGTVSGWQSSILPSGNAFLAEQARPIRIWFVLIHFCCKLRRISYLWSQGRHSSGRAVSERKGRGTSCHSVSIGDLWHRSWGQNPVRHAADRRQDASADRAFRHDRMPGHRRDSRPEGSRRRSSMWCVHRRSCREA